MTQALVTTEKIIKADTQGRLRTTAERREFLLAEFERSAMTGRKFSEWAGIRYSTFGNWWRRARNHNARSCLPLRQKTRRALGGWKRSWRSRCPKREGN
jgi:hypothetical protein